MNISNEDLDDIIKTLDSFMDNGGGHINLEVNGSMEVKTIETKSSSDCSGSACSVPTLHKNIDEEE